MDKRILKREHIDLANISSFCFQMEALREPAIQEVIFELKSKFETLKRSSRENPLIPLDQAFDMYENSSPFSLQVHCIGIVPNRLLWIEFPFFNIIYYEAFKELDVKYASNVVKILQIPDKDTTIKIYYKPRVAPHPDFLASVANEVCSMLVELMSFQMSKTSEKYQQLRSLYSNMVVFVRYWFITYAYARDERYYSKGGFLGQLFTYFIIELNADKNGTLTFRSVTKEGLSPSTLLLETTCQTADWQPSLCDFLRQLSAKLLPSIETALQDNPDRETYQARIESLHRFIDHKESISLEQAIAFGKIYRSWLPF